ncbi:MAG TPA: radical SAM family heme chaperone HemW [Candidatus Limnocylindria bacterium]|nr:radical SAM family heme chaperone HemW [Candidatus Limnocylindria bacterium]
MTHPVAKPVALYVHFPFCVSVCPYCDFVVYGGKDARGPSNRTADLVDALEIEIGLRAVPGANMGSVYFGGGTPSLMSAAQVERLLAAAAAAFGLQPDAEITIEANPGGGERGDLAGFRAAGVNRLSVGAQTFDAAELKRIGRRHTRTDIQETVRLARQAGIDNISLDLLYDVPGQTIASWRDTLAGTLALEPDHISVYALTLDQPDGDDHLPPRRGAQAWRARAVEQQDADRAADMYEIADDAFETAGLSWYEVSNWSCPKRESRHNLAYWRGDAWEAVGPGAHAFDGDRTRRWNAARLDTYVTALSAERLPPGDSVTVDHATAHAERVMLALRTGSGLAVGESRQAEPAIAWGMEQRLLETDASVVRLTRRGRLLSNELFARLLPAP